MTAKQIFFQLLEEPGKLYPEQPFLFSTKGETITYSQAQAFIQTTVGKLSVTTLPPASIVALYSEKNFTAVLHLLSVMLSGKAYLPIDVRSPLSRILTILQQAKPSAIIVQEIFVEGLKDALTETKTDFTVLDFETDYKIFVLVDYTIYNEDLAYVLFTSGSTGTPKGIMHSYESVVAFVHWCVETFAHKKETKFISIAPFQFDLSVHDLFVTLVHASSLLITNETESANSRLMAQIICENKIEIIYSTPTFFNWLMETGRMEKYDLTEVKSVLIAGEVLRWETVKHLKNYFPNAELYNLYGPTETNVCMYYHINFSDEEKYHPSVPIGKPCEYSLMKLKDTNELLIGGKTLMQRYVHESEGCFETIDKNKFYNTGDIVELAFEGNYAFVSRADRMIKRNGYRIELAEIERGLKFLEGVKQVVMVTANENLTIKIHAFLVSDEKYETVFLKKYCTAKIHYSMVPDTFTFVESIPLNNNHKTDEVELMKELNGY